MKIAVVEVIFKKIKNTRFFLNFVKIKYKSNIYEKSTVKYLIKLWENGQFNNCWMFCSSLNYKSFYKFLKIKFPIDVWYFYYYFSCVLKFHKSCQLVKNANTWINWSIIKHIFFNVLEKNLTLIFLLQYLCLLIYYLLRFKIIWIRIDSFFWKNNIKTSVKQNFK